MPEGNEQTQTPQAGASQQPQVGTPPANPQAGAANANPSQQSASNGSTGASAGSAGGKSADEYERMLADLRKEAAANRTKLKAFEDEKAAADLAKLGDLERATKERDTYKAQADAYRQRIAAYAVQIEAQKLGIIDPEVAATLIREKLDIGDDGTPSNAADLLKELVKAKPYLKAPEQQPATSGQQQQQRQPSAGATNPGRGTPANPATGQQQQQPGQIARFGSGQSLFRTGPRGTGQQ